MLFVNPYATTLDDNANPISGAIIQFYASGTSTPQTIYADVALTTPLPNPVIADAAGRFDPIYLDPALRYRAVVMDAGGTVIRDIDPYEIGGATSVGQIINFDLASDGGGDGTVGSYTAAQKFLDNEGDGLPVNTTISAPAYNGETYFRTNTDPFKMERMLSIDTGPGTVFQHLGTGPGDHAMSINPKLTIADIGVGPGGSDNPPNTTGEARGLYIRGGRYLAYTGGYGMSIGDGEHKPIVLAHIENAQFAGAAGGIHLKGTVSQATHWVTIRNCGIDNGVVDDAQDGNQIWNCNSTGQNPALTLNKPFGAFHAGLYWGTTANRKGALDVVNGMMWRLRDVQIEHGTGIGANNQTYGAAVIVRGVAYPSLAGIIDGCNFGQGDDVTTAIALVNSQNQVIDNNLFFISGLGTGQKDVLLDNSDPAKAPVGTIFGHRNNYRGNEATRVRQGFGSYTDSPKRLMQVVPSVTPMIQLQYGLWMPLFALIENKASNLADASLEVMVHESGLVVFNGGITRSSGGLTANLDLGQLPSWLMPIAQQRVPVCTNTEVLPMIVNPGNRYITLAAAGTGTALHFGGVSWMSCYQTDTYIDPDSTAGEVIYED